MILLDIEIHFYALIVSYMQATGIGGVGGGILKYPPWPKNFGKYPPPGDFGKNF